MEEVDEDEERRGNELLALESIYGESRFVADADGNGGKLAVNIELPEEFKIAYPAHKIQGDNRRDSSIPTDEASAHEEIKVHYLPPLILDFKLPTTYPSSRPPNFTLTCKWLNVLQISDLCVQLDRIWEDQGAGFEVLFEWAQFLSEETTTHLHISSPFALTRLSQRYLRQAANNQPSKTADARACQDISCMGDLVNFLTAYDRDESIRHFNTAYYSCQICFLEKLGVDCIRFPSCKHVYCKDCVTSYFTIQIRDGCVRSLHCPEDKCESQAEPNMVKRLVEDKVYEQYEKFLLQSTLDCMDDMTYCPRETCQSVVLVDTDAEKLGRCPACKFVFCVFCKRTYHGVSPCPVNSKELLKLRDDYLNGTPEDKARLEKIYGKKKLQSAVEEMYTEAWLDKFSQRCPKCRTSIEKIDGCNKMHCTKCDGYFCWLCRSMLSRDNPYEHFNDMKSRCFNRLFEGAEIEDEDGDDSDDDWW